MHLAGLGLGAIELAARAHEVEIIMRRRRALGRQEPEATLPGVELTESEQRAAADREAARLFLKRRR